MQASAPNGSRYTIEWGVGFLILFAPFAFGGVEAWAQGMVQGVTGLVVGLWAIGRVTGGGARQRPLQLSGLRAPAGILLGLGLIQLIPLGPGVLEIVSPATHRLYAQAVPGYDSADRMEPSRVPQWLVERRGPLGDLEREDRGEPASARIPTLPVPAAYDAPIRVERSLSIEPFGSLRRLILLVAYAGLFIVVFASFVPGPATGRLLAVLMIAAASVSLLGLLQMATWNGGIYWFREGVYKEVFGPFVNRNAYAAFAAAILPLFVCALLARGAERAGRRAPLVAGAALVMTGILASLSRGGGIVAVGGLLISVGVLLYTDRRLPGWVPALAIPFIAATVFLWRRSGALFERAGSILEGWDAPSLADRLEVWARSLDLIREHPWLGTGLGTFRYAFLRYAPTDASWWMTAHNEYLEMICDIGLPGGVAAAVLFYAWARPVLRPGAFAARPDRFVYAGLIGGVAAMLAHAAFNATLQVPANAIVLVVMMAILLGMARDRQSAVRTTPPSRPGWRPWLVGAIALGVVLNTASATAIVMASLARIEASSASARADLDRADDALRTAIAWERRDPGAYLDRARVIRRSIAFGIPLASQARLEPRARFGEGVGVAVATLDRNPVQPAAWMELGALHAAWHDALRKREALQGARPGAPKGVLTPEDRVVIAAIHQALILEPRAYAALDILARLYRDRGLPEAGARTLRRSFALEPVTARHAGLEDVAIAEDPLVAEAILEGIRDAATGGADPVAVARSRAEALDRMNRPAPAIDAYETLRELGGPDVQAECDLMIGRLELQRGRIDESIAALRRAAGDLGTISTDRPPGELSPWRADALYFLGAAHAARGDDETALMWYRRYAWARPDRALSQRALAKGLIRLGQEEEARGVLENGAVRFPADARILEILIDLLERQGDAEEARRWKVRLAEIPDV